MTGIPTLIGEVGVTGPATARLGPRDTLLIGPDVAELRLEPARATTVFVIRIASLA